MQRCYYISITVLLGIHIWYESCWRLGGVGVPVMGWLVTLLCPRVLSSMKRILVRSKKGMTGFCSSFSLIDEVVQTSI